MDRWIVLREVRYLTPDRESRLYGDRGGAIILYGSFSRGDFHEGSDVVGDVRERFHKAGRQPSSAS